MRVLDAVNKNGSSLSPIFRLAKVPLVALTIAVAAIPVEHAGALAWSAIEFAKQLAASIIGSLSLDEALQFTSTLWDGFQQKLLCTLFSIVLSEMRTEHFCYHIALTSSCCSLECRSCRGLSEASGGA